ncbi:ribonuclease HIII [Bacilli bacterium PM5-3]|nr:ribonuclease HIII [Bacilli bacterium PM5-3]MDH6603261.1 ribonuclease HIII [Bacilli bacterium PM5-9]
MNVVIKASNQLLEQMKQYYASELDLESNIPYTKFVVSTKDLKVIAYQSNKVMFQGKEASNQAKLWEKQGIANIESQTSHNTSNQKGCYITTIDAEHIGSDEVGTGDYFGPVVVCACYINPDIFNKIAHLNLQDSKKLNDNTIKNMAVELKKVVPHIIYSLNNQKYNEVIKTNNLNKIKAKMHNYVLLKLTKLINKKPVIVVDQFCLPKTYYSYLANTDVVVDDICFETKAEDKYLAVAIASILARNAFLEQLDEISAKIGMRVQKGASDLVDSQGAKLVQEHGFDILNEVAKVHFANTQKIKDKLNQ